MNDTVIRKKYAALFEKNYYFLRMVRNDVTFSCYRSKEFHKTLESFLCRRKLQAYKLEKLFILQGSFVPVANIFNYFNKLASCEMTRGS